MMKELALVACLIQICNGFVTPSMPLTPAFLAAPCSSNCRSSSAPLAAASFNLPNWFSPGGTGKGGAPVSSGAGNTNDVLRTEAGILHRRLGSGDIVVSELGLGTQRWGGADFNSPDDALCHRLLDVGTANGINLIDTAEQYPIPSDMARPEGLTEQIIGNWLSKDKSRRSKLVIATKITGGSNVTPQNIIKDCEGSLKRLQTDCKICMYNLDTVRRSAWGERKRELEACVKYSLQSFMLNV